jgi:hypothetical protein
LAHILQSKGRAKEIYLADAEIKDSKYILLVFEDGSIKLEWCYEDLIEIQVNPVLTKLGRRMILEFGEPNLFNLRERKPFQDEQGNLDSMWEKIM